MSLYAVYLYECVCSYTLFVVMYTYGRVMLAQSAGSFVVWWTLAKVLIATANIFMGWLSPQKYLWLEFGKAASYTQG